MCDIHPQLLGVSGVSWGTEHQDHSLLMLLICGCNMAWFTSSCNSKARHNNHGLVLISGSSLALQLLVVTPLSSLFCAGSSQGHWVWACHCWTAQTWRKVGSRELQHGVQHTPTELHMVIGEAFWSLRYCHQLQKTGNHPKLGFIC